MVSVFRWLVRLVALMIFAVILAATGGYYFASRSLPDYDEARTVAGITAPVEIVRDTADVPHIFGETDADTFFALGYAHAQDRLWQMLVARWTVQGRLSEVFGERTVKSDELMRRLDLYGLAVKSVTAQDDATRVALDAYARGVNAWIETVNSEARGRGAPELFLFPAEIAVWQPADSIALMKLFAFQETSQLQNEVMRARLSLLSADWADDLMPAVPGPPVAALPPYAALAPGLLPDPALHYAGDDEARDPLLAMRPRDIAGASNAWAAAPGRAAAGGALLANDPHMAFTAPAPFYLARLELASGGVIGATIPGVPAILAGRNEAFGWGIAASYADDQDLFLEELDPADASRYRTPEGWAPFETKKTIVTVKDAAPITLTLRWSANGPVLPGSHYDLQSVTPKGHVMALGWTGLSDADTSMSAAIALMRAKTINAALTAGAQQIAPALTVTLAEKSRVGMALFGVLPARDAHSQSQGRLPSPGWVTTNRWAGRLPAADNPRFLDPAGGIVGTTNGKLVDLYFPNHVSFDWGDSQRVQRWTRLMQEREVHSRESFIAAQLDTNATDARTILPLIGRDLWFTGEAAPEGTPERLRQKALDLLAAWDGDMNEHLPEPLIYAAWSQALQMRLIRDELGPLADAFHRVEPLFIERVYKDVGGAARWCDVMQSAPVESCTDIARLALDDALLDLTGRYGSKIESWRWGDAHEARQDHPTLGLAPFLGWIVNLRQSTSGGDHTLMRGMMGLDPAEPFLNMNGPVYRGVYDFADPDSSVFIISTGQSGHPLSRHYDDLSELWRRGDYVPMSLDPALARAAATGITRLTP
ncbi:penicillin acylase family protein [Frigidibacter sp. RF13]|uniref:penicillin acylase family protein n=1 Tax=Frigidibacter sp. RF13 TaxID=2997340 RepID=UPI00226D7AF6|nr:penicillin acylase family protein [Frigidibacter sp. RF13]MCY1125434.1 penicillin acylase family protein [Frigidibacter sp. RF13]